MAVSYLDELRGSPVCEDTAKRDHGFARVTTFRRNPVGDGGLDTVNTVGSRASTNALGELSVLSYRLHFLHFFSRS